MKGKMRFLVLAAALLAASVPAGAACVPVTLAPAQAVRGRTIALADLLPACASANLLAAAAKVSLGAAPNTGALRVLRRAEILRAVAGGGMDAGAWRIPEEMEVRRASRSVSRDEVFHVLRDALERQGFSGAETLLAGDVRMDARVELPEEGGGLELAQINLDPVLARGRFLLRQKKALLAPPVVVTAGLREPLLGQLRGTGSSPRPRPAEAAEAPVSSFARRVRMPAPMRTPVRTPASGPVLVRSGQTAQVLLTLRGFVMQGEAVALESGRLGETIRIRLGETGKILRARVRSGNVLEASY